MTCHQHFYSAVVRKLLALTAFILRYLFVLLAQGVYGLMEKLLVFCNNAIKVSSANPDKARIAHSDGAGRPELTIAKFEYKIRYSPFKKKKKTESVVIHAKKALQTVDTVQKNRRC